MRNKNCQPQDFDKVRECSNFDKEKNQHFKIIQNTLKTETIEKSILNNYFIFVLKGACTLAYNDSPEIEMLKLTFALTPANTKIKISIEPNSTIMMLQFRPQEHSCNRIYMADYKHYAEQIEFKFNSLHIKPSVETILIQIQNYIDTGLCCGRLFELKQEEFFFCLRKFYTKLEVVNLLYPILECQESFKEFVQINFTKVQTVTQLIQLSTMCKTYFYERFKEEFGITAKQWMLKQKVKQVERKFAEPDTYIKDVVRLCNFPSAESLHTFCKKNYGLTPAELIKRSRIENQQITAPSNNSEEMTYFSESLSGQNVNL